MVQPILAKGVMMIDFRAEDLGDWLETKKTLHAYARVISAVPRQWNSAHPRWWHIGLRVSSRGLETQPVALPNGQRVYLRISPHGHQVQLEVGDSRPLSWPLAGGLTAGELADEMFTQLGKKGLEGDYNRSNFDGDAPRRYDPERAEVYFRQAAAIADLFEMRRRQLQGDMSPVFLWPHGFDIALDWFGTRKIRLEKDGNSTEYPAQLNLGWSPGEPSHPKPYFFSNPWPFDDALLAEPLPEGARWFTEGWKGSIIPHQMLVGVQDAGPRLLEYAQRIYSLAQPYMMAPD